MVHLFGYIFGSVILVSLISIIGVISLLFKTNKLQKALLFMVSFSAGALLGDVFIHLIPEIVHETGFDIITSLYILIGILFFFALEKFIHWHHCHSTGECDVHGHEHSYKNPHSLAIMNLVGDGFHNLIDGMIIGVSYMLSIPVGIATTIAVILHEIPQEIADFGVLLHAGLSRTKALLFNFLSAILAIVGAAIALVLGNYVENITHILVPLTIGGFIYIAGVDLIPELHKLNTTKMSIMQLLGLVLGILVMLLLLLAG